MRKVLFFIALFLGVTLVKAQEVMVTVEGKPINNGETVYSSRYEDILLQFGTLKLNPEVVATFSEATDVTVRVYNNTKNFTNNVQFCWPTTCLDIAPGQMKEQSSPVEANVPQGLAIDVTVFPFSQEEKYEFNTVVEILYGAEEPFTFNLNMIYPSDQDIIPSPFVTVGGNQVENGATISSFHLNPELVEYDFYKLDPEVKVVFQEDTDVLINVYNKTSDLPHKIQFNWPELCASIGPNEMQTQTKAVLANQEQELRIDVPVAPYYGDDFIFDPSSTYTFLSTIEIFYGATEPFTFDLNMIYDPSFVPITSNDILVTVDGNQIMSGDEISSKKLDPELLPFDRFKVKPEVLLTLLKDADVKIEVYNKTKSLPQEMEFDWPSMCAFIGPEEIGTQTSFVKANEVQDLGLAVTVAPYYGDEFVFDSEQIYTFSSTVKISFGAKNPFIFDLDMIYDPEYKNTLGITDFENIDNLPRVYYDLSGRKVAQPQKGIYILQVGNKFSKIIL